MALAPVKEYLQLLPAVKSVPYHYSWPSYDPQADVLCINFKKPGHATDSEITADDIIVRSEGDEIIGLTILHASQR